MKPAHSESGSILLDAFMSLFLGSIVLGTALVSFTSIWSRSNELRLKAELYSEARLILDMLAFDIRMSGSGMPLGQSDFDSSSAEIGEAALPVLPASHSGMVSFRINEFGASTTLTAPFSAAQGSRTLSVASTAGFSPGDTLYLSNMPVGGTAGLRGSIASVGSTTITLDENFIASPSALFAAGSTVEPVKQLVYEQSQNRITRDDGDGPIVLAPQSSVHFTFLDLQGNALTVPLTAEVIKSSLAAVRIQIELQTAAAASSNNTPYSTVTSQTVALRNINLNR